MTSIFRLAGLVVTGLALTCPVRLRSVEATATNAGLVVTYTAADGKTDAETVPNVALFVASGASPSPFLPPGKFSAIFEGTLSAELRGEYFFQVDINGAVKLEINGVAALEFTSETGATSPCSKAVQLKKGANQLKAIFSSPSKGDAMLRLAWSEKGKFTLPIPLSVLAHEDSAAWRQGMKLRLGRELFLEHRCVKCHGSKQGDIPEMKLDAPAFEGIGARRNFEWMARWIENPKSIRPMAWMPRLVHDGTAKEEAVAMAAYLSSLTNGGEAVLREPKPWTRLSAVEAKAPDSAAAEPAGESKPLFESLHCAGCHNPPDAQDEDPKKIPLKQVGEKFAVGKLSEFLRRPEAHYTWIRMPNFRLTSGEAKELSDYLLAGAAKPKETAADASLIGKGKELVQGLGCLQCHALKLDNKFKELSLAQIVSRTKQGKPADCLGDAPYAGYAFTLEEKGALRAFLAHGEDSLQRHVPAEFAARQTRDLNCTGCHGQVDGFPPLELLGGKLRPEWAARFIDGEIPYKPRAEKHPRGEPWLAMRMPAFQARGRALAEGLAAMHGYPPVTPPEPPADQEQAKLGQKLVGKDGGFSCISCHGAGALDATEVFESEGINLAYSTERLLPQYYRRWVRNPQNIDPQTKMPVYFDEGKSPLTDILEGDGEKQIEAIWQYLRLGTRMPPPSTGAQ